MANHISPTSQEARVCAFFQRNPDEYLTQADIRIKFEIPRTRAYKIARKLVLLGLLESSNTVPITYRWAALDPSEVTDWRRSWLVARGLAPAPQA